MKFTIIAMGNKMPLWIRSGFKEYAKRMPPELRIDLVELKPADRGRGKVISRLLQDEASGIEAAIPREAQRIVLDERGQMITTKLLMEWLKHWLAEGANPCFIIGGADGLDPALKKTAHRTLSLSGCTLPHGLVRVLLAEQIYRAWTLLQNHPYHRE